MPLRQLNLSGQGTNVIPVNGVQPQQAPMQKPFSLAETGRMNIIPTQAQQTTQSTSSGAVSVSVFSQRIKEKYPEYANVDDTELAQKIVEKYPEYRTKVDFNLQEQQQDGLLKRFGRAIVNPFARLAAQVPLAFGKGLETRPDLQTDLEKLGVTGEGYQQPMQAKGINVPLLGNFKPVGYDESGQQLETMGQVARDVIGTSAEAASYFTGAGQAGKAAVGAKSLAKGIIDPTLKTVAKQAAIGEGFAGLAGGLGVGLQDKDATVGSVLGSGAIGAGAGAAFGLVFPFAGAGINKLRGISRAGEQVAESSVDKFGRLIDKPKGNVFQQLGQGIEKRIIKPTGKDLKGGFKVSTINEFQLGGTLEQTFYKTEKAINDRMAQLNDLIKQNGDVTVGTYQDVITSLRKKFESGKGTSQLGKKKDIMRALDDIESELDLIDPEWRSKPLDFGDAVQLKRAAGEYTSFLHDPIKGEQTSATEEVWNALYRELMAVTEKNAPEQFKQLNKDITKLIPVKQAVVRRIPVAARNNIIGISDLMGGVGAFVNPGALALPLLQRLFNSGRFANLLMKMGGSTMPSPLVTKPLIDVAKPTKPLVNIAKKSTPKAVPLLESAQAKQARMLAQGGEIAVSPKGIARVTPAVDRGDLRSLEQGYMGRPAPLDETAFAKEASIMADREATEMAFNNFLKQAEIKEIKDVYTQTIKEIDKNIDRDLLKAIKNHPYFKKEGALMDAMETAYIMDNGNTMRLATDKMMRAKLVGSGYKQLDTVDSMATQAGFDSPREFLESLLSMDRKRQRLNEGFKMLKRGKRPTGEAMGALAGIEPELDENGKPTGKFKFNATKAMLGMAGMTASKRIAPKFAGKGDDLIQQAKKFKTADEFIKTKPIKVFHVTEASNAEPILRTGFKAGSELPEDAFRGGGYGQMQKSISFADNPKDAFTFAISQKNSLMEAELRPGAKIKNLSGVEYAEELNDKIPSLLKDGFDAVKLLDSGEGEIVVINPKALQNIKNTLNFKGVEAKDLRKNYQSDGFTLKQLTDIWEQANKKTAQ